MGKNERGQIVRDGFVYSHGKFRAGHVDRMEGSELRAMFLPNLSLEGRRVLAKGGEAFVRGQLLHYGVAFREDECLGCGALLMKIFLRTGKRDKVPDHILFLRAEMHAEWLDSLTPDQLSSYPEFAMEKYFLTAERPDKAKTTTPVGIPFDRYSSSRTKNMREAAQKVEGLHCAKGMGPKTQTIFMGWDEEAVRQAALSHAGKEAAETQVAEKQREEKRDKLHQECQMTYSPVGHYIVDCEEIEQGWDDVKDLNLDINETDQDGIFRVVFDFGILVGVMLICADKRKLNAHVSYLGAEYESDERDTEESESDEEEHAEDENQGEIDDMSEEANRGSGTRGRKRKSQASAPPHKRRKKSRMVGVQPFQYFIKFRCRETGEGELYPEPEDGTLRFKDKRMAAFLGKVDMPCVGGQIPFAARKISNLPRPNGKSWSDYSDSEYEYA
ncbi:unnamed protein product [Clonostachys rhizophaga]|uniref:Uncharacterized protein n=1 Tax=Clonostachys rhizophaga TaxID=160324 RepID=A0A9N9VSM7_9HYPO|nr:unnamed protein product [Clonostachys rhizophaga]